MEDNKNKTHSATAKICIDNVKQYIEDNFREHPTNLVYKYQPPIFNTKNKCLLPLMVSVYTPEDHIKLFEATEGCLKVFNLNNSSQYYIVGEKKQDPNIL